MALFLLQFYIFAAKKFMPLNGRFTISRRLKMSLEAIVILALIAYLLMRIEKRGK